MNQINRCEVCGNQKLTSVLNLGPNPLCDDLIPLGDSRICREYPIEIMFCETCLTAHQHYQVPKQDLFQKTYHYRSRFTSDVLNGMKALVDSCEEKFGQLKDKKILDIGCNDGSLLDFFRQKGALSFGLEPTDAFLDAREKGHTIFNDFLAEDIAKTIHSSHGTMDFITFTNVFAHIENLGSVIRSLKILMNPRTVIVIENHYLGSVLDGNQFDTFYHEHPRSYSYTSFVHIARSLGLPIYAVEFPSRYGGNIRIFLAKDTQNSENIVDLKTLAERESHFLEQFTNLGQNVTAWRESKKAFIQNQVRQYGKLKAKAFPGRAAILIKALGLDEESISAVYEKPGSLKINHYVPGTRIPILSDDELFQSDQTKPLLNLAWHIPREIRNYLKEHNYHGPVLDILSAQDFALV